MAEVFIWNVIGNEGVGRDGARERWSDGEMERGRDGARMAEMVEAREGAK